MVWLSKDPIDSWDIWGLEGESPESIISFVRSDVHDFLEVVAREYKGVMILEGRKSSFLISHGKNLLEEAGCSLQMLRYNRKDHSFFHGPLPDNRPVAIMTDSIHEGEHIVRSIEYLTSKGVKVQKVFSYLTSQKGLANVLDQIEMDRDKIHSYHLVSKRDQYKKYSGKLHGYFKSRIIPMDTDIPYDLYSSPVRLPKKNLIEIFRMALSFDSVTPEINQDLVGRGLPKSIWEIGFIVPFKPLIKKLTGALGASIPIAKPESMFVHFKVRKKPDSVDFTVIPDAHILVDPCSPKEKCPLFGASYCPLKVDRKSERRCAACFGEVSAYVIFSIVKNNISRYCNNQQITLAKDREYRPLKQNLRELEALPIEESDDGDD